jgi:hypothetical protein
VTDPTRYLVRALEVVAYALACAGFLYVLDQKPGADEPLTRIQAVALIELAGLVFMVVRATR